MHEEVSVGNQTSSISIDLIGPKLNQLDGIKLIETDKSDISFHLLTADKLSDRESPCLSSHPSATDAILQRASSSDLPRSADDDTAPSSEPVENQRNAWIYEILKRDQRDSPSTKNDHDETLSTDDRKPVEIAADAERALWSTTVEIDQEFDELCQRYLTNLNQYRQIKEQMKVMKATQHILTPITEESMLQFDRPNESPDERAAQNLRSTSLCSTLTVRRQANHIGHYGFELDEISPKKIRIASITDVTHCPSLSIGDELLSVNSYTALTTLEECRSLLLLLWHKQYEHVQITVRRTPPPTPSSSST